MKDPIILKTEISSVSHVLGSWINLTNNSNPIILDAGCGDGSDLICLSDQFPNIKLCGCDKSDVPDKIKASKNLINYFSTDLTLSKLNENFYDVIILKRVIHTILNTNEQHQAFKNLHSALKYGGLFIIIEAFKSGLNMVNIARKEFDLDLVQMPKHNLHLEDQFFESYNLQLIDLGIPKYFLSTHYYLSYVLYPALAKMGNATFRRNNYFSPFMGDLIPSLDNPFGPNRFYTFMKV